MNSEDFVIVGKDILHLARVQTRKGFTVEKEEYGETQFLNI